MSLQDTNLLIQGSQLPATFRGKPNDLFQAMLARMKIVSPSGTSFIVVGDTEPTSNQGPWLKSGTQWFVWDSNLKKYVPLDISESETKWYFIGSTTPPTTNPPLWLKTTQNATEASPVFGTPVAWYLFDGTNWVQLPVLIPDIAITAAQLGFTANKFGVASGIDTYSVDFSPGTNFSHGDGVTSTIFFLLKFSNGNSGPSTLNVNGTGVKYLRRLTGEELVAGNILAGSIHAIAYDGEGYQILSDTPIPTTLIKGIPTFLATQSVIFTGGAVAWTNYPDLVIDGVPTTASAIILQFEMTCGFSACDGVIEIRKSAADATQRALALAQSANGESQRAVGQGIYPVGTTAGIFGFDFRCNGTFDGTNIITLVGYVS